MPQLDPSSFVSQIFWLTITFLSLVFVMSVFIVPRIASIIDERHQKINSDIQKAEKINQKAANILKRYETAIENAKAEIDKKISQNKSYSGDVLKYKLLNEFINKGYNKEDILNILDKKDLKSFMIICKFPSLNQLKI